MIIYISFILLYFLFSHHEQDKLQRYYYRLYNWFYFLIPQRIRWVGLVQWLSLSTLISADGVRFPAKSCSFLIVSLSKSLSLRFMCSNQHVKYWMSRGFPLTSTYTPPTHARAHTSPDKSVGLFLIKLNSPATVSYPFDSSRITYPTLSYWLSGWLQK